MGNLISKAGGALGGFAAGGPLGALAGGGAFGSGVKNAVGTILDPLDLLGGRHASKTDQLRNSLFDNSGRPSNPTFRSVLNRRNELQNRFSLGVNQDEARLRNEFTDFNSNSPIAQAQLAQNSQLNLGERNRIASQSQQNLNQSLNGLANRGGLNSGARERLARQQIRTNNRAFQDQAFENSRRVLDVGARDANRKFSNLQGLANTSNQRDRFNIGNTLGAIDKRNANDQNNFALALKEFGARKQTELELNNRPKGGLGGAVIGIFAV